MTEGKEQADRDGSPIRLHQFSRHIVNGGNVIGIHGVPQAQTVGQETQAQGCRVGVKHGQGQRPGGDVQPNQEEINKTDATAQCVLLGTAEAVGDLS